MSDAVDGETGGDSGIGDKTGDCGGVVKREDAWEVKGDEGGRVSRGGGVDIWDLVRGASVGVCSFWNSEGK
jgi:hypothetical protein